VAALALKIHRVTFGCRAQGKITAIILKEKNKNIYIIRL